MSINKEFFAPPNGWPLKERVAWLQTLLSPSKHSPTTLTRSWNHFIPPTGFFLRDTVRHETHPHSVCVFEIVLLNSSTYFPFFNVFFLHSVICLINVPNINSWYFVFRLIYDFCFYRTKVKTYNVSFKKFKDICSRKYSIYWITVEWK
jgi:hypothetical protein